MKLHLVNGSVVTLTADELRAVAYAVRNTVEQVVIRENRTLDGVDIAGMLEAAANDRSGPLYEQLVLGRFPVEWVATMDGV